MNKEKTCGGKKNTAARVSGAITKAVAILDFNILLFFSLYQCRPSCG